MGIKIYNTLTRQKEEFKPLFPPKVGFYVCGPTVYDSSHLGHARTYIIFDVIRKWFEKSSYDVNFISNITDVHDSIIDRAKKENTTIKEISDKVVKEFYQEIKDLGIKPADKYPRVSEYIPQIIEFIKILIDKGFAYKSDGSVYFDISKFENYGKLSHRKLEAAKSGTRVDVDKYEKDEAIDFALWKKTDDADKKVSASWQSPWGEGRPGWHIECSVMSKELLGEQFDIHAGANDLLFPHHENEIAQSEAASGKSPFVKYWMHSGLLTTNNQKMSKSLGNFITIKDVQPKHDLNMKSAWIPNKTDNPIKTKDLMERYPSSVIRFWVLSTHYRSPLDYSEEALERAKAGFKRIIEFSMNLSDIINYNHDYRVEVENNIIDIIKKFNDNITKALDNDFNTPEAIAEIFEFIKEINRTIDKHQINKQIAELIIKNITNYTEFLLGVTIKKDISKISEEDKKIMKDRNQYRRLKKFDEANKCSEKLTEKGYTWKDTLKGTRYWIYNQKNKDISEN
ncbi:MAG: cysteine--tRNA ligase [bacterium]